MRLATIDLDWLDEMIKDLLWQTNNFHKNGFSHGAEIYQNKLHTAEEIRERCTIIEQQKIDSNEIK